MTTTALDAARDLFPLIDRHAADSDAAPLADEVVAALAEAGLYGVMCPREVGGMELSLVDALDVFVELARADGSTGWNLMAGATTATFFAVWTDDTHVERMFASGVPIAAGQFAPNGTAVAEGDGYTVTGRYSFGSGMAHATWAGAGVLVQTDDPAAPEYRFMIMPKDQIEVTGNWDVMGLRRTMSWDYTLDGVSVPTCATFPFIGSTRYRGGPTYDLGVIPLTEVGHAGFAIGLTQRVLEELATLATTKQRMGAATTLSQNERFLHDLGLLRTRFEAARRLVYDDLATAERTAVDGPPSPAAVNRLRATTTFVTHEGADIARQAYLLAGTTGLREGPIERAFRDLHAGTQHAMASTSAYVDHGRSLL